MSITRLQQARQMYAQGQRVAKTLDGSRPGYRGPGGYQGGRDDAGVGGQSPGPGGPSGKGGMGGKGGSGGSGGNGANDRSSDLQTYNTKKATNRLGRQDANQMDSTVFYGTPTKTNPSGTIDIGYQGPLNEREQAFQNFVDYRKPVQTFGLSSFFKKPIQAFSDFNASINRPYFEKVVRAGKIPGLSFDMTQRQFEDAYQNYMSNRLAGKTDAYGNPMQGFEYGDDNILTGRFQDDGGEGIMDVVDDNTVNDDADGDGDVDQDDFIFKYFDKTGETLQAGAGGVGDLMTSIRKRISNLFS